METGNAVTLQTRTRQLFRLRSFLATLHREGNTMSNQTFKIVTGAANHTGVAIFNYGGHTVHVTPNQDGNASSILVYRLDTSGVIGSGLSVFGPVSATLENLGIVRNWIDGANALPVLDDDDPTGTFPTIGED